MEQYQIAGFWVLADLASELRRSVGLLDGAPSAKLFADLADEWSAVAAYRHTLGGWGHE